MSDQDFISTKMKLLTNGSLLITRTQDVDAIIERNKQDQNDSSFRNGYSQSGDMKHVARIPLIMLEKWAQEAGIPMSKVYSKEMGEIVRRKLNDPDNKFMRTGLGQI